MKWKTGALAIAILGVITLQSTAAYYIRIYGIKPNLPLVLIICVSFLGGSTEGAIVGLIAGFCQDIVSGRLMGFYALLGLYTGLITGAINRRLYRENLIILVIFTYINTVIYELLVYLLNKWGWYLAGNSAKIEMAAALKTVILPEAVYNCVAAIPLFFVTYRLYRVFNEKKAKRML